MKKYLLVSLLVIFIIPSIAFASWWNPFSWNWFGLFNKNNNVPQVQQEAQQVNNLNLQPVTTQPTIQGTVFSNQYLTVIIPDGWTAKESTYKTCIGTGPCTPTSLSKASKNILNPTAVNITKDNYILYINARTGQASGVEGGRFVEIAGGSPSVDAVETDAFAEPCENSNVVSNLTVNGINGQRTDFYVGPNDTNGVCKRPSNGKSVWYFSYFGAIPNPDTGTGYFNQYNVSNISPLTSWVVTMAYNSKDINSLPIKGSDDLNQALTQMSDILKTLKLNTPVAYVPAVSQTIKAMSNTDWTAESSEGINTPVEGCTDTASTNNINESDVKASYYMESLASNKNDVSTMYKSADVQTRVNIIRGMLANNGWSKCNSIIKQSPQTSNLQTTDNIDVYQNGSDFVDVDSNYAENVNIRIPSWYVYLTFYTLK